GNGACRLHQYRNDPAADGQNCVRRQLCEIGCSGADQVHVVGGPALVELNVDAFRPAPFPQLFPEGAHTRLHFHICRSIGHQKPDAPDALVLLRPRRERPRGHRAAEQRDELAAFHSITSSASASSFSGTSMPSARAVFRLITNSNLVGCWSGKSLGLTPL